MATVIPKVANWVGENTLSTGAGPVVLAGAVNGFAPFSVIGNGLVYYTIQEGDNRECGIGTLSGNVLQRTTVHATFVNGAYSTTGQAINLQGFAQVFCTVSSDLITKITGMASKLDTIEPGAQADQNALEVPYASAVPEVSFDNVRDMLDYLFSTMSANKTSSDSSDTTLQNNIDAEEFARTSADSSLQALIDQEVIDRANAVSSLQSDIDAETLARTNADSSLQSSIDQEVSNRTSADSTLQNNIDAEASTRQSAVNTLQANLNSESTTRLNEDAKRVLKISGSGTVDQGAAVIPYGTEAQRPASSNMPLLRGRTDDGSAEYYNPITDTWGSIGSGVSPAVLVNADTVAEKNKVYAFDMTDNVSKKLTLNAGTLNDNEYVGLFLYNWDGTTEVRVTLEPDAAQPWQHPRLNDGAKLHIGKSQVLLVQMVDSKLNIAQGTTGENQSLVDKGYTLLWSDAPTSAGTLTATKDWKNFDDLVFELEITATGGAFGVRKGTHFGIVKVSNWLELYPGASTRPMISVSDSSGAIIIHASAVSDNTVTIVTTATQYSGGLTKIYGVKR